MKQRAIIVDIDGTVAHHRDIRGNHDYAKVSLDVPDPTIIELVNMLNLCYRDSLYILVTTGRPLSCRDDTRDWLNKHRVPWHRILMRETGDYRADNIVKEEIYRRDIEPHYDIWFVLDDRDRVVKMWRELGLKCLQVAEGNF